MKQNDDIRIETLIRLSGLADGELTGDEARELLQELQSSPALYRRWRHYLVAGDVLRRRDQRQGEQGGDAAFVSRVMDGIASEDAPTAATSGNVVPFRAGFPGAAATDPAAPASVRSARPMWRVLAAAASVAAVALALWMTTTTRQQDEAIIAAASPAPAPPSVPENPADDERVSPGEAAPGIVLAQGDSGRNAQLNAYLLSHNNSARPRIGGAWGLVRVAAHSQQDGR